MKNGLIISVLTILTFASTTIYAVPALSTSWKDVSNLSHKQCMNNAERVTRNSGYKGKFSSGNNSIFKHAGKYNITVRCGKMKTAKFVFFVVAGPNLSEAKKIRKNISKNFVVSDNFESQN